MAWHGEKRDVIHGAAIAPDRAEELALRRSSYHLLVAILRYCLRHRTGNGTLTYEGAVERARQIGMVG